MMTPFAESDRSTILSLVERVLEARLDLRELLGSWPVTPAGERVAPMIFEELEMAIAHMPGEGYPVRVSIAKWNESIEKLEIELLRFLLQHNASMEELDEAIRRFRRNMFSRARSVQDLMHEIGIEYLPAQHPHLYFLDLSVLRKRRSGATRARRAALTVAPIAICTGIVAAMLLALAQHHEIEWLRMLALIVFLTSFITGFLSVLLGFLLAFVPATRAAIRHLPSFVQALRCGWREGNFLQALIVQITEIRARRGGDV